ncbi:hypothetical protein ACEWFA_23835, partial [Klebsiella pneumoniae]|uniref:hypothetical protein n=1 Tax=Klebsiella pneumoniae TaxID=573 RepID=UPI0035BABAB4
KGWDARKRAYCLKIQPATGSFARNLIYSTKPGSVYRRSTDTGITEIEAAGRAAGQNIWLTRMRSGNSGFHVGKGECPL